MHLKRNIEILKEAFPKDYKITALDMDGTYLAWLDCRKLNLSVDELNDLFLNKAGVWLHNGATFGKGGEGFVRASYCYSVEHIKEALLRIEEFIKEIKT